MAKSRPLFEHKSCTRCGGCGQYSYNQIPGSVCYGCGGSGFQLTKRGKVAQKFYSKSLEVPFEQIRVGDPAQYELFGPFSSTRFFVTVTEVHTVPDVNGHVGWWGERKGQKYGERLFPCSMVRKAWSAAEKQQRIEAALAFQATLTKFGAPMKRR